MRKEVRYPENLEWKGTVAKSGRTITELAEKIGVSRLVLSSTLNGHYKGTNVIPKLKSELEVETL